MRNLLIHEYDHVNLDIVWEIIHKEISALIKESKLQVPPET